MPVDGADPTTNPFWSIDETGAWAALVDDRVQPNQQDE